MMQACAAKEIRDLIQTSVTTIHDSLSQVEEGDPRRGMDVMK
jgi:hypothetical protein